MACMDHVCKSCNQGWSDNRLWKQCPVCYTIGTVRSTYETGAIVSVHQIAVLGQYPQPRQPVVE